MITNGQAEFDLDLTVKADQAIPSCLRRAIALAAWSASIAHQAYHHGLLATNVRPNPDGSDSKVYDPVNLDALTWRSCPKNLCASTRTEIAEVMREARQEGLVR